MPSNREGSVLKSESKRGRSSANLTTTAGTTKPRGKRGRDSLYSRGSQSHRSSKKSQHTSLDDQHKTLEIGTGGNEDLPDIANIDVQVGEMNILKQQKKFSMPDQKKEEIK